jgi:hypothetical protein
MLGPSLREILVLRRKHEIQPDGSGTGPDKSGQNNPATPAKAGARHANLAGPNTSAGMVRRGTGAARKCRAPG